jgi:hypothetical protein
MATFFDGKTAIVFPVVSGSTATFFLLFDPRGEDVVARAAAFLPVMTGPLSLCDFI